MQVPVYTWICNSGCNSGIHIDMYETSRRDIHKISEDKNIECLYESAAAADTDKDRGCMNPRSSNPIGGNSACAVLVFNSF